MLEFRRPTIFCAAALILVVSPLSAQVSEERPEVKKFTREELDRRKSEEIVREAQALFGLGVMRHRGDRWLEALTLLEQAAKLDPKCPAAHRALVPLYLSLAREEDAVDAARRVLQLDPDDSDTAYQLAKLLKADGRTKDAIAALVQGAGSKRADESPDLLYYTLSDLADLLEKAADYPAATAAYRRLTLHLVDHKARLIGSETLPAEQYVLTLAQVHEKTGHCLLQQNRFDDAVIAFQKSRDFLAKQTDPELRIRAVRLNWNLANVCLAQEKWADALTYLDAYLDNRPTDAEPYEKKVMVLRKLDRENDVVPALKKHAGGVPDSLSVQLLYAKELSRVPRSRREAESVYLKLAERFTSSKIYGGLFELYRAGGDMVEVLNLVDKVLATINSKDDIQAETRETAREQGRAMLQALKAAPDLVNALLRTALKDVNGQERTHETWQLLAALASRAKLLENAEVLYRQCLIGVPVHLESNVYQGLLQVLWQERKYDAIVVLCKEALYGRRKAEGTNLILFHNSLALALSETDKIDESILEIDKAIKLGTERGKTTERCQKARILAKAERFDAAIAECESMLKELTEAAEIKQVRYVFASVYTFKGDHEKSEAQLLKILEDDPNDAGANNDLGYQWADRSHNLDEAEKMIRRAIEVDRLQRRDDPEEEAENAAYLDSLGWVLFRKGKLDEARDWLEKASALQLGADDPTVWDHLGDVYFKLKQTAKARDAWQKAAKLYDHDKRGRKEGRQEEAKRKLKMVAE